MPLKQIPNPYSTDWRAWIDTVVGFNNILIPNVSPDDPWQVVAERLVEYASEAPLPAFFASWQEWAAALKQVYPQ